MNAYERLLEVMRKQGKKDNPSSLQLGNYETGKVKLDNQTLDADFADISNRRYSICNHMQGGEWKCFRLKKN